MRVNRPLTTPRESPSKSGNRSQSNQRKRDIRKRGAQRTRTADNSPSLSLEAANESLLSLWLTSSRHDVRVATQKTCASGDSGSPEI